MSYFCKNCGSPLETLSGFCPHCGYKLSEEAIADRAPERAEDEKSAANYVAPDEKKKSIALRCATLSCSGVMILAALAAIICSFLDVGQVVSYVLMGVLVVFAVANIVLIVAKHRADIKEETAATEVVDVSKAAPKN